MLEAWYLELGEGAADIPEERIREIREEIFQKLPGNSGGKFPAGILLAAAAIAVIMVSLILEVVFHRRDLVVQHVTHDIPPGGNRAVLTLSNGQKIDLTHASNGSIAVQQGTRVLKNRAGLLVYDDSVGPEAKAQAGENTVTTPVGGSWQLNLPDGTRVWLNNSSSLTYPSHFRGQPDRMVTLAGEAYFEVAKDKRHPFIVKSGGQEVKVLGTHFDVNAFANEHVVRTTLLEGLVTVSAADKKLTQKLFPGNQSLLQGGSLKLTRANLEQVVAWKNGYFRFDNTPIEQVMRELARWYDIDVRFDGTLPTEKLNGRISRSKNISKVLSALEATKTVHFKMEGRRVTVMK
ncbi:ferric-dicitrate binding protein FerR (iron transport regulator) [Mucilaginibacter rubeus]|uniref:FecR family protein n=1 Tax=Mucilaginibacter rubeus TaxID=2027860 RepID=UPI00339B9DBA